MYLCLCWGQLTSHAHPPGRAVSWARCLLWLPEEGKGGLALCLSRRENPLSGDPLPPVPCSVPSNHHPDRAPGPLVPAGPTGEIPWASRLLLLKVWPEGFISISWKQRISGPSPAQAPTDSESRIQQDLQVIHLNTKCEKHCPGLPLPCAGGRVVWGLIYRVPQPGYRFPGLCWPAMWSWIMPPSVSVSHPCIRALALPPSLGEHELNEMPRVKCLQPGLAHSKHLETLSCHS